MIVCLVLRERSQNSQRKTTYGAAVLADSVLHSVVAVSADVDSISSLQDGGLLQVSGALVLVGHAVAAVEGESL